MEGDTSSRNKTHPPAPGKMPREVSGRHRVASGVVTRISQARASSTPQPKLYPVVIEEERWDEPWGRRLVRYLCSGIIIYLSTYEPTGHGGDDGHGQFEDTKDTLKGELNVILPLLQSRVLLGSLVNSIHPPRDTDMRRVEVTTTTTHYQE